jgi:hypothetical protein
MDEDEIAMVVVGFFTGCPNTTEDASDFLIVVLPSGGNY